MDLRSIVEQTIPFEPSGFEVDITDWLVEGSESEPVLFRFRAPTVQDSYLARLTAEQMMRKHPEWDELFCYHLALLSHCHQFPEPPEGVPIGTLYIQLAEKNDLLIAYLWGKMVTACPYLYDIEKEVAERKKGSPRPQKG